jgi:hypothetical protein
MNLKPEFWNADKIVSFSAILISLATMAIYLYQTHLIQKQQHASVMPYLMTTTSNFGDDHFLVELHNNGLGPAFIEEVNVYYLGKKYENSDFSTFFSKLDPNLPKRKTWRYVTTSSVLPGILYPTGHNVKMIEISKDTTAAHQLRDYFWSTDIPIELEIIYSSIYGEKWLMKGNFKRPQKLED